VRIRETGVGSRESGFSDGTKITSFRDLRVWQAGMELVEQIYRLTAAFPRAELYGLIGQMQRAAVSVPSNIAEGHTRSYTREYLHHLAMAHGSLSELRTQIEIAIRLGYLTAEQGEIVEGNSDSLSRQLTALRAALTARLPESRLPNPESQNV
jgi:four helix bundle protein